MAAVGAVSGRALPLSVLRGPAFFVRLATVVVDHVTDNAFSVSGADEVARALVIFVRRAGVGEADVVDARPAARTIFVVAAAVGNAYAHLT